MTEQNTDDAQHDERFDLDGGQWEAIKAHPAEALSGFACNVSPDDHVHVGRRGEAGSRLGARALVAVHEGPFGGCIYLAAPQARSLAARLLDLADEIDGETPLTFYPPQPGYFVAPDADGDPTVWRENPERPDYPVAVARFSADLLDEAAWDALTAHLPRREA